MGKHENASDASSTKCVLIEFTIRMHSPIEQHPKMPYWKIRNTTNLEGKIFGLVSFSGVLQPMVCLPKCKFVAAKIPAARDY